MARLRSVCGHELPPGARDGAEYCSSRCKQKAYRLRKAKGERPKAKPVPTLNQREFDRMMDGSMEDELRHVRDRLKTYVDDPGTPANAMPSIVAKYLAVCEKLHDLSAGDPLAGLLDEQEVSEDAGASVV